MTGEHTLQHQRGAKGYYGKIRLQVSNRDSTGIINSINFIEECEPNWKTGIEFGIVHAWEVWQRHQPNLQGVQVEVLEVGGQMVDTSSMIMAFVAANAFWKAVNWAVPTPPVFDPKSSSFTFSK
jgi:hypothetical protein